MGFIPEASLENSFPFSTALLHRQCSLCSVAKHRLKTKVIFLSSLTQRWLPALPCWGSIPFPTMSTGLVLNHKTR